MPLIMNLDTVKTISRFNGLFVVAPGLPYGTQGSKEGDHGTPLQHTK